MLNLRFLIESKFAEQAEEFAVSESFTALENGTLSRREYDKFVANLCRTHLKSPHILAFLYAVAPPAAAENLKHNMLEELGLDDEAGISHPALLRELAAAANFDDAAQEELENAAQEELRRIVADPILFGTLREVGLSVLLETVAFEWMLSRLAGRMADFLTEHYGFSKESLRWFYHHSEVDIKHAEEGLRSIQDYVEYYEFEPPDVEIILDVTFRENVFLKRYFSETAFIAEAVGV